MNTNIELSVIETMKHDFLASKEKCLHRNAVTTSGIVPPARNYEATIDQPNTFSLELPSGKITAQKQSGRCWLFAATNVLRMQTIQKYNLEDDFELSQTYLFFWDKLEKANYFLENILNTLDEPQGSRILDWLLLMPFNDGGQWDMMVGIVEKYGIVPKTVMPDTAISIYSQDMNKFLTLKSREFAKTLRDAYANGETLESLSKRKEGMLEEIFGMLCVCLGTPPTTFDFEITTKDKTYIQDTGLTPLAFYEKYVGVNLSDYVSLINSPTTDKPYYHTFTVSYLGSVMEATPIRYLNLPVEELKIATQKQLEAKEPVWFGSDVAQMLDREAGLMSMQSYDYETLFSTAFPLDKAARLDYGESLMTHAMVITGVNLLNGTPNRWKVENSWGEEKGTKGWFRMTDEWFSEYVYQVVINKKFLTPEQLIALEKEPIALNPWDPMGSLA